MNEKVIKCYGCGVEFRSAWSEEESRAEAVDNGFDPDGDNILICDDCYKEVMSALERRPDSNANDTDEDRCAHADGMESDGCCGECGYDIENCKHDWQPDGICRLCNFSREDMK